LPESDQSFIVDDASRVWHSWAYVSSQLQSIAGDATASPVPGETAYDLGAAGQGPSHAVAGSGGEVFVICGTGVLKRLTPAGTPAADWPDAGLGIGSIYDSALLGDGAGGVIVMFRDFSTRNIPAALHVPGTGVPDFDWGVELSNVSQPPGYERSARLLASGPSHFLAVWTAGTSEGSRRVVMQRC